ncbi:MAG: Zn-dependent alcohol dehydrogenase [Desulfarculaceae bacterium]|nr:Zn-dependent alcohol dehydrogenase [Desulfarculaceae bacterium]MCF8071145.1 Zn-dependent alcohol dehydrogenase [Desulfarculaceae bacterium]MCF8101252.1 Zn-dependent alcohol dehydrogenase [Desulfarculaceae bacterium]MCF8115199.1 Zn-dependent alcohol dehydrogenase [Desulfarculaceae bacterium]
MKTSGAVLYEHNTPLVVEELELAPPRQGEVLVEIKAAGICHSDLSVLSGVFAMPPLPAVPGHEGAGIVREVGPGVDKVKPGDHVMLLWAPTCGGCFYCQHEQPYLCDFRDLTRGGLMPDGTYRLRKGDIDIHIMLGVGTFNHFNVVSQNSVLPIDKDVPFDVAALTGCGVITGVGAVLNTAKVKPGSSVVVIGCGGVGINVIQGAVLAGATRIIAVDLLDSKLEQAREFGATHTINSGAGGLVERVIELTKGRGADYAFDMVGSPQVVATAVELIRRGGKVILVGMGPADQKLDLPLAPLRAMEKSLLSCYYGSSDLCTDLTMLLDLYKIGRLNLDGLITQRYSLEQINQGFDDLKAGKNLRGVVEL